ncbi:exodeoxyribonuclease V subunit gamma [Methylogaea oryzae]|uniref:exodeoxyribonuclease V subunit gamma n=1 Tax=Methylogaea oryzae TaxID=1295382 RepID=UPI0006CF7933|nr:exodeoxyribonuclease V subunit gamma [Methylogaea oryzae]
MLYLHQSHRLEVLLNGLAEVARSPLPDPFAAELMVVQSKGMGRWISLRLAERQGVCANVQFPLPASFLWQLLRLCFGELPERSAFAPEVLVWRIRAWLERAEDVARSPRLAAYLNSGDERRRQQLAERLADVFDQYLVYRPDWIEAWEEGRLLALGADEEWQAALWRHLAAGQGDSHRARLVRRLLHRLEDGSPLALPPRVSVFGVSSLPPVFLDVLQALARRIDVHVYALNPCREYWGEIRDQREIARIAGERSADDLYLEVGHPLLASLGKQGRDFFDRLAEFPQLDSEFAVDEAEPPRRSLLEVLQADILELRDRRDDRPWRLAAEDDSLQVHVCHGPMREVEVLHDRLLHLFQRHPDLQPDDVAVLTPDIGLYAPYVEAVFSRRQGDTFIPYSIADRGMSAEQPLLEAFLALLDLPDSRYPTDWVLGLMEHPAVLRRFGLEADDLDSVRHWLQETGVRWGRDGDHKAGLGLPATTRHTWREA